MTRRAFAIIVLLAATSAFCFGDSYGDSYDSAPLFIEFHWQTFSNISRFQESTTNLPPEVRSNILAYLHEMNVSWKTENSGDLWMTNDFRLVWRATDGTNYVVHWQPISRLTLTLQNAWEASGWPNYCITAAIQDAGATNLVISSGLCDDPFTRFPLKDYKAFVDFELAEARRELDQELGEAVLKAQK
jgi:hypothetical protein